MLVFNSLHFWGWISFYVTSNIFSIEMSLRHVNKRSNLSKNTQLIGPRPSTTWTRNARRMHWSGIHIISDFIRKC
jgi:hypothetical protein